MKFRIGYKYKTLRHNSGFWNMDEIVLISNIQGDRHTVRTTYYPGGCDTWMPSTHFVEICQKCYSENCPAKSEEK